MHTVFLPRRTNDQATRDPSSSSSILIHPAAPRIPPMPFSEWPLWTRALEKLRSPQDRGLGDTIIRLIGNTRSERFKKWFSRKFGRTCGCTERQHWLNEKYPYAPH